MKFKKIIQYINLFLILPIVVLKKILKPIINFNLFPISYKTLGNMNEYNIVNENLHKVQKKILFNINFFFLNSKENYICNQFIVSNWKKRLKIFNLNPIIKNIIYLEKKYFSKSVYKFDYWIRTLDHAKTFSFSDNENNQAFEFLEKSGLEKNQKWVCIANRTHSHNLRIGTSDHFMERDSNRNFPINFFTTAVERLIKEGYFIFRIGKFTEDRIEKKIQGYKDISLENNTFNDFIHCFLLANAEFSLLPSNGITSIPMLYKNRKFAIVNNPQILFRHMYYYKVDLPYLPKIAYNKSTGNPIHIRDYYNQKLFIDEKIENEEIQRFLFKDNSKEDLDELINEILKLSTKKYSIEENKIRQNFLNNLKDILPSKYHNGLNLNYGTPSVKFLEQNSSVFLK